MKEKISEEELCKRFISAFPKPDSLYYEVECYGGVADMVFVEKPVTVIYEAKTSFSTKLLLQCIDRRNAANYVIAVIPGGRFDHQMKRLFSDYGIGVISVETINSYNKPARYGLREDLSPKMFRATYPLKVKDFHKTNIPGTQHGRTTGFGNMVNEVVAEIKRSKNQKISLEDGLGCQGYYKTLKQFKGNIYQWCRTGIIKDFYLEQGYLFLGQPEDLVPVPEDKSQTKLAL